MVADRHGDYLASAWSEYRAMAIPPRVADPLVREIRDAFYAGVATLYGLIGEQVMGAVDRDEGQAFLDAVHRELQDYAEGVLAQAREAREAREARSSS